MYLFHDVGEFKNSESTPRVDFTMRVNDLDGAITFKYDRDLMNLLEIEATSE